MNARLLIACITASCCGIAAAAQDSGTTQKPDSTGIADRLREASVVARRELVVSEADKLTYNVEADPLAEGASLLDILRKVPMLSINAEEKVLLNGTDDYKVLVNGKPTGMLARNFNSLIRNIPASTVKEIQVITNPPVKYDAEGIGGVINIVTSRRLKSGYSGSLGAFGSNLGYVAGNSYVSAQLGRFTLSSNISGAYSPMPVAHGITDVENLTSSQLRYQRTSFGSAQTVRTGAFSFEASCEIDSLNLVTLSVWANAGRNTSIYNVNETFLDSEWNRTMEMDELIDRTERSRVFSGELAWQKTFRDDGLLTLSYSVDGNPCTTFNNIEVIPVLNYPDYRLNSSNTARTVQQIAQADYYATPGENRQIEAGAKYTLRNHVAESRDETGDDLDYHQHIFAAYGSYGYRFRALTLKAGARLEYTLNRGLSKSASGDMTFDNSNFNIVPYLNASWQISPGNSLSASYTRRLGRPGISWLNPYVREETPVHRIHGNPDLRTVVSDALTLTFRTGGDRWGLTARTYGSLCGNKIEYLSTVYPDGMKISTYENAVKYRHVDAMLSLDWNPIDKIGIHSVARTGYDYYHAPSIGQSNSGLSYAFDLSFNSGLWKGAAAFASASLSGGEVTLQRTYRGADYYYYLGMRQGFLQNRLTLTLMAVMPFQDCYYGAARDSSTDTYRQQTISWHNPRYFNLNLTWRFGKTSVNLRKARKSQVDDKI